MPPKKKAANGYKFAEPLPKGTVLEDIAKKKWKLGPSIGKGGFGEIYSAQADGSPGNKYPFVVKIEPHSNGPLFVEINFYIRHAKPADIEEFRKQKGFKSLGMPVYYGSGSHEYKNEKYRFLVMDKFGSDLHKLYLENNKILPTETVFQLAIQILDVLEYIHSRGYVHADIKAANILMSARKETLNKQVYLVDFGLATKYTLDKQFKPNPKKAHDGTIEYLSRDAHQGVQTRRGDLEILGYNLIQWLGATLPWEGNLSDPKIVQKSKEEHMSDIAKLLKACFKSVTPPKSLVDFLKYLNTLNFDTEPDYQRIRQIFVSGVQEAGGTIGGLLKFSKPKVALKRKSSSLNDLSGRKTKKVISGRKKVEDPEIENGFSDTDVPAIKKTTRSRAVKKKTEEPEIENGFSDTDVPAIKKTNRSRAVKKKEPAASNGDGLETYTEAMKQILSKMQNDPKKKAKKPGKKQPVVAEQDSDMNGYTDEMKEIAEKKKARQRKKNQSVPVATTSKGRPRRGHQDNGPLCHGDVVTSRDSSSE